MTKSEKKESKLYKKTNKRYRKQLIKMIKNDYGPWDYGCMLETLEIMIDHWVDYYTQGYNVIAQEVEDAPSRLEIALTLQKLLKAVDEIYNQDSLDLLESKALSLQDFTNYEQKTLNDFFSYLSTHICYMWD